MVSRGTVKWLKKFAQSSMLTKTSKMLYCINKYMLAFTNIGSICYFWYVRDKIRLSELTVINSAEARQRRNPKTAHRWIKNVFIAVVSAIRPPTNPRCTPFHRLQLKWWPHQKEAINNCNLCSFIGGAPTLRGNPQHSDSINAIVVLYSHALASSGTPS